MKAVVLLTAHFLYPHQLFFPYSLGERVMPGIALFFSRPSLGFPTPAETCWLNILSREACGNPILERGSGFKGHILPLWNLQYLSFVSCLHSGPALNMQHMDKQKKKSACGKIDYTHHVLSLFIYFLQFCPFNV